MALFVAGYLTPWAAFAAAATTLRWFPWTGSRWTIAALCALAAAWTVTSIRARAMTVVYSFAPALAPDGWESVRDCVTSGTTVGSWCVVSCWPLMLACALSNHDLGIVIAGGMVALVESRSFRPPVTLVAATCGGLAVFAML
jgi:hypothetical protein